MTRVLRRSIAVVGVASFAASPALASVSVIPEPGTAILLGAAAVGAVLIARLHKGR